MRKRSFVCVASVFAVAVALLATAWAASAAGWNHNYTDASNDTSEANVDITGITSHAQGTDVVLELTVRGVIDDSSTVVYAVYTAGQGSSYGMFYASGVGVVVYVGGSSFNVTKTASNKLQATMPQSGTNGESSFDIVGFAADTGGSSTHYDYAGSAYDGGGGTGGGTTDAGLILGMAFGLFLLLLLVPIIVLIVIILVIVLVLHKKKAPVPPPAQQPPYPQQQYPQQQYPQYPPQQYPPPPQQYPPQGPPPQPPGQ